MDYYLRAIPGYKHLEAWKIDDQVAVRVGVPNPEHGASTYFQAADGETVWEAIKRGTPWFGTDGQSPFHKANLGPGLYYPRIARPIDQNPGEAPGWSPCVDKEADSIAVARSQLTVLTRQLDRICQTVHPTEATFDTFGHDIRNLLILCCTEVEAHWRGVLTANGVTQRRLGTREYVKLVPAMKLNEYAVKFRSYPWLDAMQPYMNWGVSRKPSQELKWYDAYNAVKHNREVEFERATLRHAFEAASACFIMLIAQFGLVHGVGERWDVLSFFQLSSAPKWAPPDVYIFPYEGRQWSPVNFNF